jgi:hypothetical protein
VAAATVTSTGKTPAQELEVPSQRVAEQVAKLLGCQGSHRTETAWAPCEDQKKLIDLVVGGVAAYRSDKADPAKRRKKKGRRKRTVTGGRALGMQNGYSSTQPFVAGDQQMGTVVFTGSKAADPEANDELLCVMLMASTHDVERIADEFPGGPRPHITVLFVGDKSDRVSVLAAAASAAETFPPIDGYITGFGQLGIDKEATVAFMDCPPAADMRAALNADGIPNGSQFTDFKPHMTVGGPGAAERPDLVGLRVHFDTLAVSFSKSDDDWVMLRLGGPFDDKGAKPKRRARRGKKRRHIASSNGRFQPLRSGTGGQGTLSGAISGGHRGGATATWTAPRGKALGVAIGTVKPIKPGAPKRHLKPAAFDPHARDGDGNGIAQQGTTAAHPVNPRAVRKTTRVAKRATATVNRKPKAEPFTSKLDSTYMAKPEEVQAEVAKFDALPDDAPVTVFHGTSKANADAIRSSGVAGYAPRGDDISKGSGHHGLYVAPTPKDAQTYAGKDGEVVEMVVPKGSIKPSPEAGKDTTGEAFYHTFSGAYVEPDTKLQIVGSMPADHPTPPVETTPEPGVKPVDYLTRALPANNVDFPHVGALPHERRLQISDAYDALPNKDPKSAAAFKAMASEVHDQFEHLTKDLGVKVDFVNRDPYKNVQELTDDLSDNHHIAVLRTASTGAHPIFTNQENDEFRAVHDAFGHAATGRGFDRHGEEAAYQAHKLMFSPLATMALATETRGQNASLIEHGKFATQKAAVLPEEFTKRLHVSLSVKALGGEVGAHLDNLTSLGATHHASNGRHLKPAAFDPHARDGDGNGIAQQGTTAAHPINPKEIVKPIEAVAKPLAHDVSKPEAPKAPAIAAGPQDESRYEATRQIITNGATHALEGLGRDASLERDAFGRDDVPGRVKRANQLYVGAAMAEDPEFKTWAAGALDKVTDPRGGETRRSSARYRWMSQWALDLNLTRDEQRMVSSPGDSQNLSEAEYAKMIAGRGGGKLPEYPGDVRALAEYRADEYTRAWADTAGDHSELSNLIQQVAGEEFHAPGADSVAAPSSEFTDDESGGVRSYLRSVYSATQAEFRRQGITEVHVHRGVYWMDGKPGFKAMAEVKAADGDGPAAHDISARPLTSWSANLKAAEYFAQGDRRENVIGGVFSATVPVDRILSTPAYGPGAFPEDEFVVIGAHDTKDIPFRWIEKSA